MDNPRLIPPKTALLWLFASTLLISGTAGLALLYYNYVKDLYASDDNYEIVAIVQSSSEVEGLKTVYISELLDLSVDRPTNLYRFHSQEGVRKLLQSPLVKDAHIKKIRPGMLFVDYEMRKPMAFLIDYENTAIDKDWIPFPFKPFFTPKRLPEIYLGISHPAEESPLQGGEWGSQLRGQRVDLAKEILDYISENVLNGVTTLKRIDVASAYASSCGQRQVVVILEEKMVKDNTLVKFSRLLRLSAENYKQELSNYFILQPKLLEKEFYPEAGESVLEMPPTVIELRLPQQAYVS